MMGRRGCRRLNEEKIQLIEIPVSERVLDHGGLQVAKHPGGGLLNRSATASETQRIIFCGEVAHQGSDAISRAKQRESLPASGEK